MIFRKTFLLITGLFSLNFLSSLAALSEEKLERSSSPNSFWRDRKEEREDQECKKDRELTPTMFTADELKLIKVYSEYLYEQTKPDDVVVFVGRSPWIISHYWQHQSYDRQFYSVSFSGNPYERILESGDFRENGPTEDQLRAYSHYLDTIGLKEKLQALEKPDAKGKVVLVDYTITGSGITHFAKVLLDLRLLNAHSSVIFFITNDLFSQKTMDLPHYSARQAIADEKFPFSYKIVANSFIDMAKMLKVKAHLGCKFGKAEFSMPGLGKYKKDSWTTVNPANFEKTGNIDIDLVRENARRVWDRLEK